MGLTIATKDRRFSLKMDEEKCEAMFNAIVTKILTGEENKESITVIDKDCGQKEVLPVQKLTEKVMSEESIDGIVPENGSVVECEELIDPEDIFPEKMERYSGFLYLECPFCGKRRAFCSRRELSFYKCNNCGKNTELHDLAKMHIKCECGKRTMYQTNITDEIFDMNCIECGSPVAVQYNSKKKVYETIR